MEEFLYTYRGFDICYCHNLHVYFCKNGEFGCHRSTQSLRWDIDYHYRMFPFG